VISIKDLDTSPVFKLDKKNQDSIPNGTQKSTISSPSLPMSDFKSKIELLKKKKKNEMNNINRNYNDKNDTQIEFTPIIGQIKDEPEVKIYLKEHKANIKNLNLNKIDSNGVDGLNLKRSVSQSSNKDF